MDLAVVAPRPRGGQRPVRRPSTTTTSCRPTASWTARSAGCSSTSGCSGWPRTRRCRCWSGPGSWPSSRSNLDEFFMVRVAGLKRRIATGLALRSASGLEPREVLEEISVVAHELMARQARIFMGDVRPALAEEGITLVRWDELSPAEQEMLGVDVPRAGLPGADAAGRRPGAPVPLHLRALAQPRRRRGQPQDRASSSSPGSRCRRCCRGSSRSRSRAGASSAVDPSSADPYKSRFVPLEDLIAAHLRVPLPRHGGAPAPHLPGHPQRGPRGRGGRRREPAARAGEGAHPPPVRAARAARGRRGHRRPRPRPAGPRARHQRVRGLPRCRPRWT